MRRRKRVFDWLCRFFSKSSGKKITGGVHLKPEGVSRRNSCSSCFANNSCSQLRHSEHKIMLERWRLMERLDSLNEPYGTKRLLESEQKFDGMRQLSGENVVKLPESDFRPDTAPFQTEAN